MTTSMTSINNLIIYNLRRDKAWDRLESLCVYTEEHSDKIEQVGLCASVDSAIS